MGKNQHRKNSIRTRERLKADFRPFRGWRYNPLRVNLGQVIAPPYDVISPAGRQTLYAKSPFNVVRLILGKEPDFYEQARLRWETWSREGVLIQEAQPAIYLYEQTFTHPSSGARCRRTAVMGLLKLEEQGAVLRHEATFKGPKKDRFLLLEKTKTNLSPVFGLYRDPDKVVASLSATYRTKPPLFQVQDDEGVTHQGWAIEDKSDQKILREALGRGEILIADGHHRYETALEYRRQMRKKFPLSPRETPLDFVLMALVESEDEGLLVLPTHRILRSLGLSSKSAFLERLRAHFEFLPHPEKELFGVLDARPEEERVFGGLFGEEGSFLLRLKHLEGIRPLLPGGKPPIWYEVEANLLSHFVFDVLWGNPRQERESLIEYTRFWEEAVRAVQEKKAEAAFLLRSPKIDAVRKLAEAGERMPQKTTYFYPKLASGLLFYHHG